MMRFEIYQLILGQLYPTGFWARGRKIDHVENVLYKQIKKSSIPCLILVTPYKPDPNGEIS